MKEKSKRSFSKQLLIAVPSWIAIILFVLIGNYMAEDPVRKEFVESIFSSPSKNISVSPLLLLNHGKIDFTATSSSAPLTLRSDRGFRSIDLDSGMLGKQKESWMTECYLQPEDGYLNGINGNIWVYRDDKFMKARVVGKQTAPFDAGAVDPEFVKIFDTSPIGLNYVDAYRRDNKRYFHVYAPGDLIRLKKGLNFQSIDLESACAAVEFPPRQKREPWMTKCYYYKRPASESNPMEEFWIFVDSKSIQTFVIAQYAK